MSWSTRKLQFRCIFQPQNWGKLQHKHFQVFYTITRSMSTSTLYRIRPSWHVRALNWLPKSNILILQFIVLVSINMLQLVSMSWSCPPSCASLRLPTPPLRSFPASHNFRRFGMNNCSTGLNFMVVLRSLMEISKPNFFDNGPLTPRSCIIIPDFPSRTSSTSFNGYHPMWWFIMLIMKFIASPCFVLPSILSLLAERGMILNCFPVFLEMKKMLKSSLLLLWHRPCRTDIDGGWTHPRHCLTALYIWNERRCSTKDVHWFRILVHAMANSCRPPPELLIRCAWCFGRKKPVNFLFLKFGNISINSFFKLMTIFNLLPSMMILLDFSTVSLNHVYLMRFNNWPRNGSINMVKHKFRSTWLWKGQLSILHLWDNARRHHRISRPFESKIFWQLSRLL